MRWSDYAQTWRGSLQENFYLRMVMLGQTVVIVILACALFMKRDAVVMTPPMISSVERVTSDQATGGYKESFAQHVALLLGNVTPRNAPFISEQLGRIASPRVYQQLMAEVQEQSKRLAEDGIVLQYTPRDVFYLPEVDRVIVSGEMIRRGVRTAEEREVRTYEIGIEVRNYLPSIIALTSYKGPWIPPKQG